MKVLDITEYYSDRGGGIRSYLTAKGQALCNQGVEHRVLAPGPHDETSVQVRRDPDEPGQRAATSQIIRLRGPRQPYDRTYHFLVSPRRIRRVLWQEQPDVLEIHSPYMAAAGALAARRGSFGVRTLLWHTAHLEIYARPIIERRVPERARAPLQRLLWTPYRTIARGCAATIALSRWQAGVLEQQGFSRVVAIPYGVRKQIFSPDARSEACRRELLGSAGESAWLLVGAGRLAAEKRWDVVLDAFFRLRHERDARLLMVGDGPERDRLERRVAGRDDVRFLGFERDPRVLARIFASADALVHGAPAETFGITQAEALSCGLPAVLPDAGALSEHTHGPSVELYAAEDADACHAALERLLARDRATVREAALAAAAQIASVDEHFHKVVDLYQDLLAEASNRAGRRR